jgi:hypothetical protein
MLIGQQSPEDRDKTAEIERKKRDQASRDKRERDERERDTGDSRKPPQRTTQ